MDRSPFLLGNPDHFERPEMVDISGDYINMLRLALPASWVLEVGGWWAYATPRSYAMPAQGFKIHLSSAHATALKLLRVVLPTLLRNEVAFKTVAGPQILEISLSKNYGRGASGKFVAIYPKSESVFRLLLEELHTLTGEFEGPYILSDMKYSDSKVLFYRYGAFKGYSRLKSDGRQESLVRLADGSLQEDIRYPYYKLPEGINEPFSRPDDISRLQAPVLNGRYRVTKAIQFSNSGGVYIALDESTGLEVVVKEARPFIGLVDGGSAGFLDSRDLLGREHEVLLAVAATGHAPAVVDLFEQEGHRYLVQEKVEGQPLRSYRARDDVLLHVRTTPQEIADFLQRFCAVSRKILVAIEDIHKAGVLLCDFSPSNAMVQERDDGSISAKCLPLSRCCCSVAPA